jgi:multidrug efflux pump subunit AcrB
MWIVRLALRRPYTFVVMAIAIALLGSLAIVRTPTDIFPQINIPVVSVIWSYSGMAPDEMEGRIVTICERAMTTTVNSIEHIESQSLNGVAVIRVFFQPDAKIEAAVAEVTAINQTLLRIMPPGTTPPLIIRYSASNVPILQAALTSETLSEQQLYDYGLNFIRTQLATVQGAQVPLPFGGKARQVMVDLDQDALFAKGLSPIDVSNAVNAQNVILPSGTAKMGDIEYNVRTNSSPDILEALNDIPVRQLGNSTVYLRDVAQVRDGYAVQTSMVHADGRRSAMLSVLKTPVASTLDIVRRVKETLPRIQSTLPPELNVKLLFDQSLFVKAALAGVVREAAIAAGLTAVMILVFLGSWRSTLVIALSIPLSIFTSVAVLAFLGETLNVMTLGGLALAVGILVDDATVEIENIHRNLGMGKPIVQAILDGAREIATPAFVSTLAICIVFVPVAFLSGAGKYLFTPLALAVVFAMLASYLLSRTVVPTLVRYLLPGELDRHEEGGLTGDGWIERAHAAFNRGFERLRDRYAALLSLALRHRLAFVAGFAVFVIVSIALFPFLGEDFFPDVDAGQFRLHVRCAPGTRIEETEQVFAAVEASIRRLIPAAEIDTVLDNIGIAGGGVNLAFTDSSTVSSADGEILVALNRDHHAPTQRYVEALRSRLGDEFPAVTFFFQSADIVSQILNFGLPAPIDVQLVGRSPKNVDLAEEVRRRIAAIPGAADVHLQQVPRAPEIAVDVDRTLAAELGLTQRDVASSLLVSLSSSGQAAPNYWLNRQNGVNYQVAVQTPQYRMDSMDALGNTPITAPTLLRPQLLTNVASTRRTVAPAVISHYNVQPVVDVLASVQRSDLGSVMRGVQRIVADLQTRLPRGSFVSVRGQAQSMQASFSGLAFGLVFAVVLVYLLMVVNFQSWLDPLIILMALPGAASGICWMLFVTQTTVSVPALMGAIMSIGVATSNSILMITFANDQRREGLDATAAALSAGSIRLRPVLMTALAMVLGMLPMALGFGEGGEQNAPLGRAVIGGLSIATLATLFFVPVVYSVLRHKQPPPAERELEG